MAYLVEGPIDAAALEAEVRTPAAGAVVVFTGTAREETRGKRVVRLFYEAYHGMAEKRLAEICEEARAAHGALRVTLRHRVGTVEIGEAAVVIAASAAHRAAAFDACRAVIEEVKRSAPLWKKEHYGDGSAWIGRGS
ncbi:MAG: molybdenum cofactor biosynthesis protein MoaE [Planctomycetes bacterium]|nr:molybdenum cofactor biosynthesis protein MoaE [Planctomycetota bacterium]